MKNLTIIIPLHKFNKTVGDLLKTSIMSIERQIGINEKPNVLIVYGKNIKDLKKTIPVSSKLNIDFLVNEGNTSYQNQINLAVKSIKTKYFTVLEFDDEISELYIKNVELYTKHYDDVDIFLSMIIETNEKKEAVKLTNELVWSQQSAGESGTLGFLNNDTLKMHTDFKLSGAVINKNSFEKVGGYKTNIEFTFMYEFLLRSLQNGLKIMTIPKVIYKHLLEREDSFSQNHQKNTTLDERKFWFETAIKECFFNEDRKVEYKKNTNNDQ